MAKGKPTGTIKRSAPTPFRPKSLAPRPSKAPVPLKKPSLPTQKRSVGTQIPSAPKPKGAMKPIKPGAKVVPTVKRTYTQPMAKKSGVITAVRTAANIAQSIPGLGGLAARAVSAVLPDGTPVYMRRKRRRGLTYSDIKGATRVLKLVKKFAPPGSRAKLRVRRPSSY